MAPARLASPSSWQIIRQLHGIVGVILGSLCGAQVIRSPVRVFPCELCQPFLDKNLMKQDLTFL